MARLTVELLRRRAEHNDRCLSTLEEVALHAQGLERIEVLNQLCRRLKILLLQNNLISKIEGLHRLKVGEGLAGEARRLALAQAGRPCMHAAPKLLPGPFPACLLCRRSWSTSTWR